ncbi:hypothetical protein Gorai_016903, partial [Gossypium raimondii]|nr:hypothetical protein [Gossypium raimondii]
GRIADILYQIRRFSRESERSREKIIRRELARSCNFPAFSLFNLLRLSDLSVIMTTSRRLAERKVEKFQKNITKRGAVPETTTKKGKDYPVGPVLLGFFIFVVIGSCKDSFFAIIFPYSMCMDNLSDFFLSSRLSGQRPAEVWHKSALMVLRNCEETGLALGFSFLLVL